MMNGIQCGETPDPPLNRTHINRAKQMLMIMIFFGITEHFKSSVCLMAWMHGGDPQPSHFAVSRQGNRRDDVMYLKTISSNYDYYYAAGPTSDDFPSQPLC